MAIIAFVVFWGSVIRLWSLEGPKMPLAFICLWLVGLFGIPMLHWSGYLFLAYQAVLAAILLIIAQYKESMW